MEFNPENKKSGRRTKVGTKGQVVLPQDLREYFNVKAGDRLLISQKRENVFEIYPNENVPDDESDTQ